MSRSGFALTHGAVCKNVNYAWSYINEEKRFILFGAWKHEMRGDEQLIISDDWAWKSDGNRNPGYNLSKAHISKIVEDKFGLFTFEMTAKPMIPGKPERVDSFEKVISPKLLHIVGKDYFAVPLGYELNGAQTFLPQEYMEGTQREIVQTITERNPEARKKCLEKQGYSCVVCEFNFENAFGELGRGYIHVHHLKLVSGQKVSHKVNPDTDLRPVCPNCHAMLHRRFIPYEIEELREILRKIANPNSKPA